MENLELFSARLFLLLQLIFILVSKKHIKLEIKFNYVCVKYITVESINNDNCNNENTVVTRNFSIPVFYPS